MSESESEFRVIRATPPGILGLSLLSQNWVQAGDHLGSSLREPHPAGPGHPGHRDVTIGPPIMSSFEVDSARSSSEGPRVAVISASESICKLDLARPDCHSVDLGVSALAIGNLSRSLSGRQRMAVPGARGAANCRCVCELAVSASWKLRPQMPLLSCCQCFRPSYEATCPSPICSVPPRWGSAGPEPGSLVSSGDSECSGTGKVPECPAQ